MSDASDDSRFEPATLTRVMRVRPLNCSANGCLLESDIPVKVGTVGMLRISIGGQTFNDAVEVIRCHAIAGGGGIHHLATRLLLTTLGSQGSLRQVMTRDYAALAAWLTPTGPQ